MTYFITIRILLRSLIAIKPNNQFTSFQLFTYDNFIFNGQSPCFSYQQQQFKILHEYFSNSDVSKYPYIDRDHLIKDSPPTKFEACKAKHFSFAITFEP